jgi:hypothetical protein
MVVKDGFGLSFYIQVQIKLQAQRTNIKTKRELLLLPYGLLARPTN